MKGGKFSVLIDRKGQPNILILKRDFVLGKNYIVE